MKTIKATLPQDKNQLFYIEFLSLEGLRNGD